MAGESALPFFVSCPRGVEPLLREELATLGADALREQPGGVAAQGDLVTAYRICLWSRLASRVLLPLAQFPITDEQALYTGARAIAWEDHFTAQQTFAIEVAGQSRAVPHTHFAALRVKDAIVDRFRELKGERPDVARESPDLRFHLHLHRDTAQLSLDLAGESLHQRGYRREGGAAPLKENLAAALLVRAGWPTLMAEGRTLLDPLCGSGSFVIEAALMMIDRAPGLRRQRFGFERWQQHVPALWNTLKVEAEDRAQAAASRDLPLLFGRDLSLDVIKAARANAQRAGVDRWVRFESGDLAAARPPVTEPGLLMLNPPYGERLGAEADLIKLYSLAGATLSQQFAGWRAAVFTARPDLTPRLGLRAEKIHAFFNGALECKLLQFAIPVRETQTADAAEDFANRLQKNLRHLRKWARRSEVSCYRVYDADLHEYALAVDLYQPAAASEALQVLVQEYQAPKSIDPVKAEKRLRGALAAIQQQLELSSDRMHYRLRKPQKGSAQYQRQAETAHFLAVTEHGCGLYVNLDDYLDTGLFLDHRPLRLRIQREAAGKRFLNLFCYTAAATVHAVKGGARRSLSVDLSNTYLEWGAENLALNGFRSEVLSRRDQFSQPRLPAHALIQADVMTWLEQQCQSPQPPQFDLIFCDPPTFSNSKRMEDVFDVQRDHVDLITRASQLLSPDGVLYFSTNRQGFKLDQTALAGLKIQDITRSTLDEDFKRTPPAHHCWHISH